MSHPKPPNIPLTPVKSSNVHSAGYDRASRTLRVKFHNGGVYDHYDVGPEHAQAFLAAESHGQHYHAHIKSKFSYKRLPAEE